MHRLGQRLVWGLVLIASLAASANAHVTRVEIISRADVQDGRAFGLAGAYERIIGRVYFAVDPDNIHNRQIVDLNKAPRNPQGEVEFSADLYLFKPKDMNKGNNAVLFEVSNRGGRGILRLVNGSSSSDPNAEFGDGFLLREGYTIAWLGWQFDLAEEGEKVRLNAPVAHDAGGKEIHGLVRSDFTPSQKINDMPLGHIMLGPGGGKSYPVDDPASAKNVLTVRDRPGDARQIIPRSQWSFAHSVEGKLVNDPHFIHLDRGFQSGRIYEVVYETKDPVVVGTGLAAVRDFLSYLKYDPHATAPVRRVYAVGISQSGRFLRHFLYQDFNADEQGRQVIDGVIAHVAGAGRGSFNHRFAQPSRDAQPLSPLFYRVDLFPLADLPATDPLSGRSEGLLDRAVAGKVVPKIFYTNTSYEYWSRGESLCHTTPDGKSDVQIPESSRIYFIAGTAHVPGPFPPQKREGQNLDNPSNYWAPLHALFDALDAWVRDGTAPPPSRYPHISDGTLVPAAQLAVKFPVAPYQPYKLDLTAEPPKVVGTYPTLVPQVGSDGNETSGIRGPRVTVPIATYTGWNLRDPKVGFPEARQSFVGSFIPFAKSRILELYRDEAEYLGRYAQAAMKLIDERFLVPEELNATLRLGTRDWQYALEAAR